MWGGAALLLLLPAVAMVFTDEIDWGLGDFAAFGVMLVAACGAWELTSRQTRTAAGRILVGLEIAAVFALVWLHLAVGIW